MPIHHHNRKLLVQPCHSDKQCDEEASKSRVYIRITLCKLVMLTADLGAGWFLFAIHYSNALPSYLQFYIVVYGQWAGVPQPAPTNLIHIFEENISQAKPISQSLIISQGAALYHVLQSKTSKGILRRIISCKLVMLTAYVRAKGLIFRNALSVGSCS